MTMLFYNRSQGKGEFYNITDNQGDIDLLKNYPGRRKSWTHIELNFAPGMRPFNMHFYNANSGDVKGYYLSGNGDLNEAGSTTLLS